MPTPLNKIIAAAIVQLSCWLHLAVAAVSWRESGGDEAYIKRLRANKQHDIISPLRSRSEMSGPSLLLRQVTEVYVKFSNVTYGNLIFTIVALSCVILVASFLGEDLHPFQVGRS
jgi:hypothetical protein